MPLPGARLIALGIQPNGGTNWNAPQLANTFADVRALPVAGLVDGASVLALGRAAEADGLQGQFRYLSTSIAADDNKDTLAPNAGAGRWLRVSTAAHSLAPELRARAVGDYAAARAQSYVDFQHDERIHVTGAGLAGFFTVDKADVATADDGGTVLVAGDGTRLKRLFSGPVHAEWFGAKGDNGATNCTNALQAAITRFAEVAVGASGGGVYVVSDTISIPSNRKVTIASGVTIKGTAGSGKPVFANADFVAGNSGIVILGGTVDCVDAYKTLAFVKASGLKLENVTALGSVNSGEPESAGAIDLRDCIGVDVVNCSATKLGGCGLYAEGGERVSVIGGSYSNNPSDSGVDVTTCPRSMVLGVTATGNGASGISINGVDSVAANCTATGNRWGINVGHNAAEWSASRSVISGCISVANTEAGLVVQGNFTTDVVLTGNTVRANPINYSITPGTVSNCYSPGRLGVQTDAPEVDSHFVGPSGPPAVVGVAQTAVARFQGLGSNAVCDLSVDGGEGAVLQATNRADLSAKYPITLNKNGGPVRTGGPLYPGTPASAPQSDVGLYAGPGVPDPAFGANGDFYFRSNGGAGSSIYQNRVGVWVAIL